MKFALITGASSGIGYEFAHVFAQHGHNLILTARSESKLLELKKELEDKFKIQAHVLPMDLSVVGASQKLHNQIQNLNLQVDVLVNNAGFGDHGHFRQASLDIQQQMIQLNITALTELTRLFLPSMVEAKFGKVLNVASTAAFQPGPLMSVYFASKVYVLYFSEALHEELKGTGVSITALCPGPTESGFQAAANVTGVTLTKSTPVATSASVALFGYKALMSGTAVAIPGLINRILAFLPRVSPRFLTRQIAMQLQKKPA
jgi:uncharacterized protein